MSSVFTEDWQGGTNGTTCTTSNTNFASLVDNRWTFSNSHLVPSTASTMSGRVVTAAQTGIASANSNWTAAPISYMRWYMYVVTMPGANCIIASSRNGTTTLGQVRLSSAGALQVRNSSQVQIFISPTGTVPTGAWCRVEWKYDNTAGQQRLQVFSTNIHGTSADYDSGNVSTTAAGQPNGLQFGLVENSTGEVFYDYLEVDNAVSPGSVVASSYKKEQFLPLLLA